MKVRKSNLFRLTRLILMLVVMAIGGSVMYAEKVPLDGKWEDRKSLLNDIPVTADLSDDLLTIQSADMSRDISITLIKDKSSVFELQVPASETSVVTIPVDGLIPGTYILEIRNSRGGYLIGSFVKK